MIKAIPDNCTAWLPVVVALHLVMAAVPVAQVAVPEAELILPVRVQDLIVPAAPAVRVDPVVLGADPVDPAVMDRVAVVDTDPHPAADLQVRIAAEVSDPSAHRVPVALPVLKVRRTFTPCARNKPAWSAECVRIGTRKKTRRANRNAPQAQVARLPRAEAAAIAARAAIKLNRNCWRRATTSPR